MILEKRTNFIWRHARLLERAIFEHFFYDTSAARIIDLLHAYQNEDGGFGYALETDLRALDSHPPLRRICVENPLRLPPPGQELASFAK